MLTEMTEQAETLQDLSRTEHLLVWALRAIALGHEDCPTLINTFRRVCGAQGGQALQAYAVFIKYVAMAARRRLQVHVPGCLCVGSDEAAVVAVVAAAQRAEKDETSLLRSLRQLTGGEPEAATLNVARALGEVLAASGVALPLRAQPFKAAWAEPGAPQRRVLH